RMAAVAVADLRRLPVEVERLACLGTGQEIDGSFTVRLEVADRSREFPVLLDAAQQRLPFAKPAGRNIGRPIERFHPEARLRGIILVGADAHGGVGRSE